MKWFNRILLTLLIAQSFGSSLHALSWSSWWVFFKMDAKHFVLKHPEVKYLGWMAAGVATWQLGKYALNKLRQRYVGRDYPGGAQVNNFVQNFYNYVNPHGPPGGPR